MKVGVFKVLVDGFWGDISAGFYGFGWCGYWRCKRPAIASSFKTRTSGKISPSDYLKNCADPLRIEILIF